MAKLPSFQFYPGDWLKDPNLRRCSPAARGVYIDVLCIMFEHEPRGILAENAGLVAPKNTPTDPHILHDLCGRVTQEHLYKICKDLEPWTINDLARTISGIEPRNCVKFINELINKNVIKKLENGTIVSMRLVRDEIIRQKKKEAGKKGGVKSQANAKQSIKQKGGSSSSSSSSSSDIKHSKLENAIKEIKQNYPKRAGSNPWPDAEAQIQSRLKEAAKGIRKHDERDKIIEDELVLMFRGAQKYKKYCDAESLTETRTVMQAKRFFGKNREYTDDWILSKMTDKQKIQAVKFPARGDCNGWVKFASSHKVKTKPGESQFDFENRVRNTIINDLDKR